MSERRKHENSFNGYANRYDCRKGMDCPCWCHKPSEAPAPAQPTRYPVNSLRDRVARGVASAEEVQALVGHAESQPAQPTPAEPSARLWKKVSSRDDLPDSTTRVWMFVRGVGPRLGTVTRMFELPWRILDSDWMGDGRDLPLEEVAMYVNLNAIPWKTAAVAPASEEEVARQAENIADQLVNIVEVEGPAVDRLHAATIAAIHEVADPLRAERDALRVSLYHFPEFKGTSHTTACSIWREDGQGHAVGFEGDRGPCNCGALENFHRERAEAAEAENVALREALEFAQEVIAGVIEGTHDDCRCLLCEGVPMAIAAALASSAPLAETREP